MSATVEQVKARPIIFSAPMVKAILAGRKSQTRRVMKPQPPEWVERFGVSEFTPEGHISGRGWWKGVPGDEGPAEKHFRSPFGMPGDRLWLKEAWRVTNWWPDDGEVKVRYEADGETRVVQIPEDADWDGEVFDKLWMQSTDDMEAAGYRWESPYDGEAPAVWRGEGPEPAVTPTRLRPGMFMYRWASRITLEVTGVRVERLQDISVDDVIAEGVDLDDEHAGDFAAAEQANSAGLSTGCRLPEIYPFRVLWDSINGKRPGCSWADSPWVWVIEFQRIEEAKP